MIKSFDQPLEMKHRGELPNPFNHFSIHTFKVITMSLEATHDTSIINSLPRSHIAHTKRFLLYATSKSRNLITH